MQTRYFSCKEVSEMTGYSLRAVWKWVNTGKLKVSCPGGRDYLIREEDLEEFLASDNRRKPYKKQKEA